MTRENTVALCQPGMRRGERGLHHLERVVTDVPVPGPGEPTGQGSTGQGSSPTGEGEPSGKREPERRGNVYLLPSALSTGGSPTALAEDDELSGANEVSDSGDRAVVVSDDDDEALEREDWAWVQEWRAGQEPTPWATGIALAAFSALIVGVAVWVLSAGLADRPIVAILVNVLVAAGLAPAIWLSRGLPVLRWIAAGAAVGIVVGWISAILMLPLPLP